MDTLQERLEAVTVRREADRALAARLKAHLETFGADTRAALETQLSQFDDEVNTLTEHTSNLALRAKDAADNIRRAQAVLRSAPTRW